MNNHVWGNGGKSCFVVGTKNVTDLIKPTYATILLRIGKNKHHAQTIVYTNFLLRASRRQREASVASVACHQFRLTHSLKTVPIFSGCDYAFVLRFIAIISTPELDAHLGSVGHITNNKIVSVEYATTPGVKLARSSFISVIYHRFSVV